MPIGGQDVREPVGGARPGVPVVAPPPDAIPPVGPPRLPGIIDDRVDEQPIVPSEEPYEQPPSTGLSDITQRLLNVSASDVDYLRGEPYKTTEEQAMRARMQDRVRNQYDQARQSLVDRLGVQQGFSGVLAGALSKLDEAEASEMSSIDRDIMIKAADEMRSRRGESRGVMSGLESLENQRMLQSLGISQGLDEATRQRLMDLMAALGLAPNVAQAGDISGNLLAGATAMGQRAGLAGQQNWASISTLADLLSKIKF